MTGRNGRPKLTLVWAFRLTAPEADAAVLAARSADITVSDFLREAVAAHVLTMAVRAQLAPKKKVPPPP